MSKLNNEKNKLYKELHLTKIYAKSLEEKIIKLKANIIPSPIDLSRSEAEAAMKRYTEKLRKESEKFKRRKNAKS